jgi:hypothetical protein
MSNNIIRCSRCRRRCRNIDNWNTEFIASYVVGYLCPECRTPEEDLEAQVEETINDYATWQVQTLGPDGTDEANARWIRGLIKAYPTAEIMRAKADRLAAARADRRGAVAIMRRIADNMESGDLWDDEPQIGDVDGVAELTSDELQRLIDNNDGLQFARCGIRDGDGNEVATMQVAVDAAKGTSFEFTILSGEPTAVIVAEALRRMPGGGDD